MAQVTKKQHYVWRYYLAPWTDDCSATGQIACLRDNKVFVASLKDVAHENYFYASKRLSDKEKILVDMILNKSASDIGKAINRKWLQLYCAPFDLADRVEPLLPFFDQQGNGEPAQALKDIAIENIERLHAIIENTGIDLLKQLRQGDMSFWDDEDGRDRFAFFLCNQYFRTKHMRNGITKVFQQISKESDYLDGINPANIWIPLSLGFSTRVGAVVAEEYSISLLCANEECFIVGDQPILNTYSTFDMSPPKDMEFFYPITPELAVLLTKKPLYANGGVVNIGRDEVIQYNDMEAKMSEELIFAKEKMQLESFVSDKKASD